jgi:hypothetical protein
VPVRAVSWEPNREPADDLRGPAEAILRASELPSAPASAFTRSDSRSGQSGRRERTERLFVVDAWAAMGLI